MRKSKWGRRLLVIGIFVLAGLIWSATGAGAVSTVVQGDPPEVWVDDPITGETRIFTARQGEEVGICHEQVAKPPRRSMQCPTSNYAKVDAAFLINFGRHADLGAMRTFAPLFADDKTLGDALDSFKELSDTLLSSTEGKRLYRHQNTLEIMNRIASYRYISWGCSLRGCDFDPSVNSFVRASIRDLDNGRPLSDITGHLALLQFGTGMTADEFNEHAMYLDQGGWDLGNLRFNRIFDFCTEYPEYCEPEENTEVEIIIEEIK